MPLTTEELEQMKASDLVRLKLTEDEESRLREIIKLREQERSERAIRLRAEEKVLISELSKVGWRVDSIWDLVNASSKYTEAIPVLVRHLLLPYSDRTREGIARALAVPEARDYWSTLVAEYIKAPGGKGVIAPGDTKEYQLGAKHGLACALAATVTDATMEEFIDLAKNPVHGESRILFLRALRRSKNPLAKQALKELASDPDLKVEISSWRK